MQCNHVSISEGRCILEAGHDGPHVWVRPDQDLSEIEGKMAEQATEIEDEQKG